MVGVPLAATDQKRTVRFILGARIGRGVEASEQNVLVMSPEATFHGQPFREEDTAGAFLQRVLANPGASTLTIVVAWARYRGLARVSEALRAFRERGGRVTSIVGIDEGGATRPGLFGVLELVDDAFVFHDPIAATFHPKIYLAEGDEQAHLLVGSSNLTPGGLFVNYEASVELVFGLPAENEEAALVGARDYIDRLLGDDACCRELTPELIERLWSDPRYLVAGTERRRPRHESPAAGADPDDADATGSTEDESGEPLFARSKQQKASVPPLTPADRRRLEELEAEEPPRPPPPLLPPPPPARKTVALSWSKKLPRADAQQPNNPSTNVTGALRLTKAGHAIDWRTWFREEFFGDQLWRSDADDRGRPIERAGVAMDVVIDGEARGVSTFELRYGAHRESAQNNFTTSLLWGPLQSEMRSVDRYGRTVRLDRLSDGSFRLTIESDKSA